MVQCLLTKNACYKPDRKIKVQGIVLHSTGANNPNINRYVPIGNNYSSNHWNKPTVMKSVHAFVGKMPDGSIDICQTLLWDMKGQHVGGTNNSSHIGVEICEDSLNSAEYLNGCLNVAMDTFADLFIQFGLEVTKESFLSHHESYLQGKGSNHADIDHWLKLFGMNMDMLREELEMRIFRKKVGAVVDTPSEFAKDAWEWGIKNGITSGERPQSGPTREEVMTMLYRYHHNLGGK